MSGRIPVLRMSGIKKHFPGVTALDGVDIEVYEGEVLAILGENGAGKSTLLNILDGVLPADSGQIFFRGKDVAIRNPHDAQKLGIAFIPQELALIGPLTVQENMFLSREFCKHLGIDWQKMREQSRKYLEILGVEIDPNEKVENLPIAEQQLVEIARALTLDASIFVMDEPTSALTDKEIELLFRIIRSLRDQGKSVIFVSHRMDEIFEIADRVTVLRGGKLIGSKPINEVDVDGLIFMMTGESIHERYFKKFAEIGTCALKVESLNSGFIKDISFEVKKGEVVGLAGLLGSGRTELLESIYGVRPIDSGKIFLGNEDVTFFNVEKRIERGLIYIPEDRERKGLFLDLSVFSNIVATTISEDARFGIVNEKMQSKKSQLLVEGLSIVTSSLHNTVKNLSGGNRQKVLLARALKTGIDVLLLNEPTRGIDVKAKTEVYSFMYKIAEQGAGVIFSSSELPELLAVSDTILVLHEGRITAKIPRNKATKSNVLAAMFGQEVVT